MSETINKSYNGHPSWEHWNVTLWLLNEEENIQIVNNAIFHGETLTEAAVLLLLALPPATPDGAAYTHKLILYALEAYTS